MLPNHDIPLRRARQDTASRCLSRPFFGILCRFVAMRFCAYILSFTTIAHLMHTRRLQTFSNRAPFQLRFSRPCPRWQHRNHRHRRWLSRALTTTRASHHPPLLRGPRASSCRPLASAAQNCWPVSAWPQRAAAERLAVEEEVVVGLGVVRGECRLL